MDLIQPISAQVSSDSWSCFLLRMLSFSAGCSFCGRVRVTCFWRLLQGNVEVWLGQLLSGVRQTLHTIIRQAHQTISDPGLKLLEFQSAFPAQVGLLGIQMIWTRDAEDALVQSKSYKKVLLF